MTELFNKFSYESSEQGLGVLCFWGVSGYSEGDEEEGGEGWGEGGLWGEEEGQNNDGESYSFAGLAEFILNDKGDTCCNLRYFKVWYLWNADVPGDCMVFSSSYLSD